MGAIGSRSKPKRLARVEIYKDFGDEFNWRLYAPNGRILADSGESYTRKHDAKRAAEKFLIAAAEAEIVEAKE